MRVTSKGQVTIPREVRRKLGIFPGDEVTFEVAGGQARVRKARRGPGRGKALVELLRGKARTGMSTDEILALTRG